MAILTVVAYCVLCEESFGAFLCSSKIPYVELKIIFAYVIIFDHCFCLVAYFKDIVYSMSELRWLSVLYTESVVFLQYCCSVLKCFFSIVSSLVKVNLFILKALCLFEVFLQYC